MPINPDRILYQDEHFLAVMKLSGELTVKGKGEVVKLPLFDFLRKEYPGIHPLSRLDFETSGVLIFARGKKVLADVIATGYKGWTKTYQALVVGEMRKAAGDIRMDLPTRMTGEKVSAHTKYRVIEKLEGITFVEAEIQSGKHHQIRRHFAMIGHPLLLDKVYGDKKANGYFSNKYHYHRFFLHASSVTFPHPYTGKTIKIEAGLPIAYEKVLKKLRQGNKDLNNRIMDAM
jgi:23S rRNA-/tRNA-specific pseudouridylate synthase